MSLARTFEESADRFNRFNRDSKRNKSVFAAVSSCDITVAFASGDGSDVVAFDVPVPFIVSLLMFGILCVCVCVVNVDV